MEMEVVTEVPKSRRQRSDRRAKPSLFYFSFKSLHGRRHGPRRVMDAYHRGRPGYFVDVYQRELGLLGLLLVSLSCLDAFMTLRLLSMGAIELNPVMDSLIQDNINMFISLKVALTALSLLLLVRYVNFKIIGGIKVINILRTAVAAYAILFAYEIVLFATINS